MARADRIDDLDRLAGLQAFRPAHDDLLASADAARLNGLAQQIRPTYVEPSLLRHEKSGEIQVTGEAANGVDAIDMADSDTKGDLYEYMLGKIATAGQNGG